MRDRITEEGKCLHEIDPTLRFHVFDRESSMRGDFFDRLRASIAILGYDEHPGFRWSIGYRDRDLRILPFEDMEVFTEPVLLLIESMWRVEIHESHAEARGDLEDGIDLFLIHTALWSRDTDDRYRVFLDE